MRRLDELKELFNDAVEFGAFPGATYAIVTRNHIYTDVVGLKAKYPAEEENSVDTIYDMASVSKVVSTTTCLLKLMEAGKVRLFDPVQRYLPQFKYEKITIWHLVTHTSGLQPGLYNQAHITSKEEAMKLIYEAEVQFETGTKIQYSDINYILLGFIIETISGMSLDAFAKKEIFIPLDMIDSGYNPVDAKRCAPTEERHDEVVQGIVRGKVHDETAYILGGVAGHAGLFSTASDIAKFMQMILNNGMHNGKQYLSKATIDALFRPLVKDPIGISSLPLQRSIGWIVYDYNTACGDLTSLNTIYHTGFTGTCVWIDKDNEVAFCMLSNRVHPTRANGKHIEIRSKLANYIMAHLDEIKEELAC